MSWDPPSPVDAVCDRLDTIIALLERIAMSIEPEKPPEVTIG